MAQVSNNAWGCRCLLLRNIAETTIKQSCRWCNVDHSNDVANKINSDSVSRQSWVLVLVLVHRWSYYCFPDVCVGTDHPHYVTPLLKTAVHYLLQHQSSGMLHRYVMQVSIISTMLKRMRNITTECPSILPGNTYSKYYFSITTNYKDLPPKITPCWYHQNDAFGP
jgi:hypothetical protein